MTRQIITGSNINRCYISVIHKKYSFIFNLSPQILKPFSGAAAMPCTYKDISYVFLDNYYH